MFRCNLETKSLFLSVLKKVLLICAMVVVVSSICYGFQWKNIEINPSITLTEEYIDNVFYTKKYEEEDFITTVSPGIRLFIPGQQRELELSYTAGFEFFAKNPDENNVTHTAIGRFRIRPLENLSFTLDDTFFRGTDVTLIDVYGLERRREEFWENTVTPSLEYTFGLNRILAFSYVNKMIVFDDPDEDNSREDIGHAVLTYGINERNILTFDYTYTRGDFESDMGKLDGHAVIPGYEYRLNPQTSILANGRFLVRNFTGPDWIDYRVYAFLLGLRRQFTPRLSMSAQGGYLRYDPKEKKDTNDFIANYTMTYELERTRFEVTAERGYEEVFVAIENLGYALAWGVRGSISHTLHRFWRVEVSGSYRERDYQQISREDRVWEVGGGLTYQPVDWFMTELRYEHIDFDEKEDLFADYRVNRVMLSVQFRY